jgi:hypothetical protein
MPGTCPQNLAPMELGLVGDLGNTRASWLESARVSFLRSGWWRIGEARLALRADGIDDRGERAHSRCDHGGDLALCKSPASGGRIRAR